MENFIRPLLQPIGPALSYEEWRKTQPMMPAVMVTLPDGRQVDLSYAKYLTFVNNQTAARERLINLSKIQLTNRDVQNPYLWVGGNMYPEKLQEPVPYTPSPLRQVKPIMPPNFIRQPIKFPISKLIYPKYQPKPIYATQQKPSYTSSADNYSTNSGISSVPGNTNGGIRY